ncbi:Hydroxymethylbilane synthase [Candidatus Trichorickettsia mobilis]|uniref:Porphobilinogen deaminase n=1 Tax=Candidatus Trichorickettsia mobilis TaxID=1346319 RepID=A0ABZ0UW17_9RICK|nr:hydroxymethylbilane synthase [Candidatus Trichorickettsia mobilis]WPY01178.1 Hydroxymethylbilane synthase [Candidatus Trichorickettsia mobilis]
MIIRIGTRKSRLALIQTDLVVQQIKSHYPEVKCEIVAITTTGDMILDRPLYEIGGKALFLKEIETALLNNKIDIAVHSLKDVPGQLPSGLVLGAVLAREEANDVLISLKASSIKELPKHAIVGTSSVRRKIFLQNLRPDLNIVNFRGNVESRLNKLMQGEVDATILALAGLKRLDIFNDNYCHIIPIEQMLPAVGQGVVAVEVREDDGLMQEVCDKIQHHATWQLTQLERAFMRYLDASCKTPLAAHAVAIGQDQMHAYFMLADIQGDNVLFHQQQGKISEAFDIGIANAKQLSEYLCC